jgi:cytochrome c-type biogenesis protein CcmH
MNLRPASGGVLATLGAGLLAMLLAALALSLVPGPAAAQAVRSAQPLEFRDRAEEQRFHALTLELRCVMCQNQSLADSDAPIAHDLRREVFNLMREGRTDAEIKTFLVERYGEFVLYRPQFGGSTLLLWVGPAIVLLAGAIVVVMVVRRRAAANRMAPDPGDDGQEW